MLVEQKSWCSRKDKWEAGNWEFLSWADDLPREIKLKYKAERYIINLFLCYMFLFFFLLSYLLLLSLSFVLTFSLSFFLFLNSSFVRCYYQETDFTIFNITHNWIEDVWYCPFLQDSPQWVPLQVCMHIQDCPNPTEKDSHTNLALGLLNLIRLVLGFKCAMLQCKRGRYNNRYLKELHVEVRENLRKLEHEKNWNVLFMADEIV